MRLNSITLRSLPGLVVPGGLLLLSAWALHREAPVRNLMAPYTVYFSFGTLAAAALLSWYHNYARVFCLSVASGFAVWSFARLATNPEVPQLVPAILIPLNFILLAWLAERGVLTLSGLLKLGVIGIQIAVLLAWARFGGERWESFFAGIPRAAAWTWMPAVVLAVFAVSASFLLVLCLRRQTKIGPALLWALASFFIALNQEETESQYLFAGTAGLILLLGVLEHGYDIAYLDELTGLPSRRAFNEALRLSRGNYTIAMCDVDLFKNLNDTYGHDTGDQVLTMIAGRLSNVRGGGKVFRHGGEEFAILFRKRKARDVHPVVESLREAIAESDFLVRESRQSTGENSRSHGIGKALKITISIGFADRSEQLPTPDLVLKAADEALYRAKESGRNCVCYAGRMPSEVAG